MRGTPDATGGLPASVLPHPPFDYSPHPANASARAETTGDLWRRTEWHSVPPVGPTCRVGPEKE